MLGSSRSLSRRCVQFVDRDVAVDIFGAYVSKVLNVIRMKIDTSVIIGIGVVDVICAPRNVLETRAANVTCVSLIEGTLGPTPGGRPRTECGHQSSLRR